MSQLKAVRLDTDVTPNQGGTTASASIHRGGPRLRVAAADARQALLPRASDAARRADRAPAVSRGVVSVAGRPGPSVTYGELIGDKSIRRARYTGNAPRQAINRDHRIVGRACRVIDIPDQGERQVRLHAARARPRNAARPRGAPTRSGGYGDGARILSLDADSIREIPGARVVRRRDFVGVVASEEWNAVRAAQQLRVTWDQPASLPATPAALFERMRAAEDGSTPS